ncbi:MAG: hypothetical protein NTW98_02215 [Candidatus Nomurabacteria bacterium]|nr:hypothetical protein [Candidatus Nomurabacteria bacterium]
MELIADRKKLKTCLVTATFLIYFLNYVALKFYWYYSIFWFDMLMHALGGVWVAFILLWVFPINAVSKNYFLKLVLGILFVGLSWEVFEFIFNNMIAGNSFDILDTTSDVFFDMLGGSLATLYFYKKIIIKDKIAV